MMLYMRNGKIFTQQLFQPFEGEKVSDTDFLDIQKSWRHIGLGTLWSKFLNPDGDRKDVLSFVTIFSLMMEAERTPFVVEDSRKAWSGKAGMGIRNGNLSDWIERRVYVDKKYEPRYRAETKSELDKDGKMLKQVRIHGFLRYQAYGPNFQLHKWIYVEEFVSSRWAAAGHTRVIVDMYNSSS
jgi:hypothetical protein